MAQVGAEAGAGLVGRRVGTPAPAVPGRGAPAVRRSPLFEARWRGSCDRCGSGWEGDVGDLIGYVDDELVCRDCHQEAVEWV